jgi:hypothetical protein
MGRVLSSSSCQAVSVVIGRSVVPTRMRAHGFSRAAVTITWPGADWG